jgi:hypothetical protein
MPGRRTKRLFCIIGVLILGSACNISQVVVRETVVVTATSGTEETPTELPSLVPTNTEVPPTVPPPPTATKPAPPPPQPTLPQLVVEAIPGQLKARLLHPDYFPAQTSLTFQVEAYDPEVGSKDGAGIKNVEFHFLDNNGNEMWKQVEQMVPYCSFGGDSPCPVWVFKARGNKWPSGQPIQNGTYTLQINIHAQNSDKDMNFETQFDIQMGQ